MASTKYVLRLGVSFLSPLVFDFSWCIFEAGEPIAFKQPPRSPAVKRRPEQSCLLGLPTVAHARDPAPAQERKKRQPDISSQKRDTEFVDSAALRSSPR